MKKTTAALAAVFAFACALAHAQVLDLQSGYTQTNLLTVPYDTAGGFDYDSAGDIYFFGASTEAQGAGEQDQIIEATAASGYNDLLLDTQLDEPGYGDFVTISGSTLYSGLYIAPGVGYVYSSSTAINNPPSATGTFSVPQNYDLEFSGSTAFVSADVSGSDNGVFTLNLSTGQTQEVLDTQGDYSGPIALTSNGGLIYGGSGPIIVGGSNEGGIPDIYIFSAASVQNAINTDIPLVPADASMVIDNAGNSAFAMGPNDTLYQVFNPYLSGSGTITAYDLDTDTSTQIGTLDGNTFEYYFDGIRYYDGSITVGVTDYNDGVTDFIQVATVPEPGAPLLALVALPALLFWKRKGRA